MCTYTYIYIYIYIHTHTYTHIHTTYMNCHCYHYQAPPELSIFSGKPLKMEYFNINHANPWTRPPESKAPPTLSWVYQDVCSAVDAPPFLPFLLFWQQQVFTQLCLVAVGSVNSDLHTEGPWRKVEGRPYFRQFQHHVYNHSHLLPSTCHDMELNEFSRLI